MSVFKQIFLVAVMNAFLISYCNSKNKNGNFHYIPLNKNGTSYDGANLTMCQSGQNIGLISYKFDNILNKEEFPDTEEKFSDSEELELYQKCSMQERCTNLRFPSRSDQQANYTYHVIIKYQCIDPKTSNIMNLCDNGNRTFNDTLHLMYNQSATISATECACFIDGKFSVTLNDMRLGEKQLNACSSASLKINTEKFKCMENISNFGSVFQRKILFNDSIAYIVLTLNSTSSPTMVWLKIKPTDGDATRSTSYGVDISQLIRFARVFTNDTSMVTCSRTPRSSTTKKKTASAISSTSTTFEVTSDNFTGSAERSNKISNTVVIIICVCGTCVLSVIIISGVIRCNRRKRMRSIRDTKRVPDTESAEQTQAINPASEDYIHPIYQTNVECDQHKPCDCNTHAADASRTCLTISKAVKENTELSDDGKYYDVSVKLASANKTDLQVYVESQHHKESACGYDTEVEGSRGTLPFQSIILGSDTLPDGDNYYNVPVKLSSSQAIYEKIKPELKWNDEEYSQLDQKSV